MKEVILKLIEYISALSFVDILFFSTLMILIILVIILICILKNNPYLEIIKTNQEPINKEESSPNEAKDDSLDLITLAKAIENSEEKRKNIDLTPYEEEQEEKAIISYDELLKVKNDLKINYNDEEELDGVVVKKVNLDDLTTEVANDKDTDTSLNESVITISYEHEEEFLNTLKQLEQLLNI